MIQGSIKINEAPILHWSAQNVTENQEFVPIADWEVPPKYGMGWQWYRCSVVDVDADIETRFMVQHKYEDGAASLVSEIMAQYKRQTTWRGDKRGTVESA